MRYKKFKVSELFSRFENGRTNQTLLEDGNDCFYIGAKKSGNGVMKYCKLNPSLVHEGNCILFICNGAGSVGYSLYMDRPFMATSDIVIGYNSHLTPNIGLYLVTLLDLERPRYSYGRKWKSSLRNTTIPLPVDDYEQPNWAWIEQFVTNNIIPKLPNRAKSIFSSSVDTSSLSEAISLSSTEWEYVKLKDVFSQIYKARPHVKANLSIGDIQISGTVPFISRTESNNGCDGYVSKDDVLVEKGNAITIGDTTATFFYQEADFTTGDHMIICRHHRLNKFTAAFIKTILDLEKYRFNYGRAFKKELIEEHLVRLPILPTKELNWDFMENYIKSLPFSANI